MPEDSPSKTGKEWNSAPKESHNHDSRLLALVRFLARRAAERDYEAYCKQHRQKTNADTRGKP